MHSLILIDTSAVHIILKRLRQRQSSPKIWNLALRPSEPSKLFQRLRAHFLDHGLPYIVWHTGRRALVLVHLHPLACEYVHLLRAPLAKFDVRVAPVGCLQGRLAEEAGIQEVSRRQKLSRRKVTPHILRHSHVVKALMAGVPVPMIQIAGWGTRGSLRRRSMPPWRWPLVKEAYDLHGFGPVSAGI